MFEKLKNHTLLKKIYFGYTHEGWLAERKNINNYKNLVFIKKILPEFNKDKKFIKNFIKKARIASKLEHQNIVKMHNIVEDNNNIYIVMEYIKGNNLMDILKQSKTIPIPYIVKIISETAQALHYANNFIDSKKKKLNIVHKEICPYNILISYDGVIKVINFGITKNNNSLKKSYLYMSPEQVANKKLDIRSDIFSLAAILYEVVTQKRLFHSHSELESSKMIMEAKITPPIEINSIIPKELNDIIIKALSKKASKRFSSPEEFSIVLENYLTNNNERLSSKDISKWLKETNN